LLLGDATKAAIAAGYSKKTARFMGCENLTKPNIKKIIDEYRKEETKKTIADREEILEFLTNVMRDIEPHVNSRIKAAKELAIMRGYLLDKEEEKPVSNLSEILKGKTVKEIFKNG
jgi:phage terminase small subunit